MEEKYETRSCTKEYNSLHELEDPFTRKGVVLKKLSALLMQALIFTNPLSVSFIVIHRLSTASGTLDVPLSYVARKRCSLFRRCSVFFVFSPELGRP